MENISEPVSHSNFNVDLSFLSVARLMFTFGFELRLNVCTWLKFPWKNVHIFWNIKPKLKLNLMKSSRATLSNVNWMNTNDTDNYIWLLFAFGNCFPFNESIRLFLLLFYFISPIKNKHHVLHFNFSMHIILGLYLITNNAAWVIVCEYPK